VQTPHNLLHSNGALRLMITIQINPNELSNKKVLVTGGTKGMGKAIVKRLLQAHVIVRDSYINGTEYVINGGTIPTV
jgi:hypothetical protein